MPNGKPAKSNDKKTWHSYKDCMDALCKNQGTGLGFFLGVITLMDNGLELALGFHIANNFFISFLTTSQWSAFQTPSLLKEVTIPEITILYVITFYLPLFLLLFIFAKKYRWNDWKTRLLGKIN